MTGALKKLAWIANTARPYRVSSSMISPRLRAAGLAAPALAILLAACGGDTETSTATASAPGEVSADAGIEERAEANEELLQPSDDARDVEVLSVADGSITSLRQVVDGDRPLLLWFWSPH